MSKSSERLALLGVVLAGGCAAPGGVVHRDATTNQVAAVVSHVHNAHQAAAQSNPTSGGIVKGQRAGKLLDEASLGKGSSNPNAGTVRQVDFAPSASQAGPKTVTIDGVTYVLKPVADDEGQSPPVAAQPVGYRITQAPVPQQDVEFVESASAVVLNGTSKVAVPQPTPIIEGSFQLPLSPPIEQPVPLNLPSVLSAIDSQHPVVGQARWRVQQAYAQLDQAQVLWLPSIQAGFSFHRHDGNYQASNGDIVDVNRNSFQYGLGAGATGAGTTNTRPGIVAQFHLADAIFSPKVTEKAAWAQGHAANATLNEQLLNAATAYFDLLDAHQALRIVEQSRERFAEVADITVDFAEAGEGLQADADRLRTELTLIESRLVGAEERVSVAAARLAQAISLNGSGTIVPTDVNAIPLDLTNPGSEKASLVATALQTRPELKESQALVAAACEAFKREKYAPFVPSVLLGFSTGGFGGGLGNDLDNIDGRYDFDALLTWEVRNLGFGEKAARRERSAQVQQARFEKLRVMDQVAREVSESHSQVEFRRRQIDIALGAIQTAEDSYRRNLERIRDGEGLPLEVLQSAQALESAQLAYLRAVVDYNQAQIRLQWALGFPVTT